MWKLKKKGEKYYYQDRKIKIKLNTKNVYSKGMLENVCLAIKVALDLNINKKTIQKTLPLLSFEGRFQYLNKGKIKKKLHKKICFSSFNNIFNMKKVKSKLIAYREKEYFPVDDLWSLSEIV